MSFCNVSMNLLGIPLSAPIPILSNWVSRTTPAGASSVPFTDISASKDDRMVVAVGYTGALGSEVQHTLLSMDGGSNWSHTSEIVSPQQQYSMVEYGVGVFSKISKLGNVANQTRWSSDGSTWNSGSGNGGLFKTVLFDGTRFIGLGQGYRSISNDGITYTSIVDASIPSTVSQIAYSGTKYATILNTGGSTSSAILESSDGVSWSNKYTGFVGGTSIAYGAGRFVSVVSSGGTSTTGLTSVDGDTWTLFSLPGAMSSMGGGTVCFGNGIFVAASASYNINGQWWYYSYDGLNWTYGGQTGSNHGNLNTISYIDNGTDKRFVACFSGTSKISTIDFV